VDPATQNALGTAEDAVRDLVELCRKQGRLYGRHPRTVAQVSRTAKWLLNAIATLRGDLDNAPETPKAG
jgi:hypothetical protein